MRINQGKSSMQCSSKFETSAEVRSVFFVCQHLRFLDTDAFDTEFLPVLLTLFPDASEDPIPLWIHQILKPPKAEPEYRDENETKEDNKELV